MSQPLVNHSPLAATLFYATLGVWVVGELVLDIRTHIRGPLDPSRLAVIVGIGGGIGLAFHFATRWAMPGSSWLWLAVGLLLSWAGLGLRAWSIRTLGEFFTTDLRVTVNQRVVDRGPYARLRHPSYTGILMVTFGFGIALGSWLSAAAGLLLPLAGLVIRIRYEEAMLRRELGEPYAAYAERTDRLVPGLW
jgi:protein-S-isoprenylcysteine O-methyltransferase Ste14